MMNNIGKTFVFVVLLACGILFLVPRAVLAGEEGVYCPGEILVKFREGVKANEAKRINQEAGTEVLDIVQPVGAYLLAVSLHTSLSGVIEFYQKLPCVEWAEPNYVDEVQSIPNDAYFSGQWGLNKILAPQAWDLEFGQTSPVVVAVVDSGVDLDHPDLRNKLMAGYDFVDNDPVPEDNVGHGTHMAGIIAAQAQNGIGIAGTSWLSIIMPVRVRDRLGGGTHRQMYEGFVYAVNHGARIINYSASGAQSNLKRAAVDYATSRGVLVVAPSGNDNLGTPQYPAAYDSVIAVGSTNINDERESTSNYGSYLDLAAPGVDILSTYAGDGYSYSTGTSGSAAFVSGLAALIWSRNPNLSYGQVRQLIEHYADDLGPVGVDQFFGHGRINAFRSVANTPVGTGEILGRVVNSAGQPVPGTAIRIDSSVMPPNVAGEFRFTLVYPGSYTIYYDAPGYRGQTQEVVVRAGIVTRPPTAILFPGESSSTQGEFYGRVMSINGQSIPGTAVRIDRTVIPTTFSGEFRFTRIQPSAYTIYYDAPGYKGQTQVVEAKEGFITTCPAVIMSP